jgi:hypothetical protein
MSPVKIHCELCGVYGQNVMGGGTIRQWCKFFKGGRTSINDEERNGRPSVVSDDLVQSVDQKICERWHFTISELLCEFTQILHILLYKIITVRPSYYKSCTRWVLKMLTGAHKMQRMVSALTLLEQYHKDGDEFLSQIITEMKPAFHL